MSESGGGGDVTTASTASPATKITVVDVTASNVTSTPIISPKPITNNSVGDAAKGDETNSLDAQQKHWMEKFLSESKKYTIADFMTMFMTIRMRQEQMRGDEQFSANLAVHPNHYIRNRYRDILPYDRNRVQIGTDADGYVNASHVSLPNGLTTFIAAQAPLPTTLDDFWQMVEEQGVRLIVMLCKLVEMNKVKCERYWPDTIGASEIYGIYEITLEKEEGFDDDEYVLRTLSMRKEGSSQVKTIHQLHYKEWPDHGCPAGSAQLLNMVDRMAELVGATTAPPRGDAAAAAATPSNGNGSPVATKDKPPVLVHCSAGVGRTGTIILINHIRELILQKLFIDVNLLAMVVALREQRSSMVQTQDQFQFVHRCVLTYCRRALGLEEVEDGELPLPPPYVTSMPSGSVHPKLPTGLEANAAVVKNSQKAVQQQVEEDSDEEDEDTDFEDATDAPDYPAEPTRAPRGPEDVNGAC
ncbi:hypothetical protein PFISCL1PPCAC_17378 [Pristionchus fissidentatus]|uniref:Tyrosine phosphatase n=1 Tax=Pristionchus fissidentatus TaxID=1538716 RepID=A0AAV5W2Q2_9BILA|nr:hypothetical protein PFISCL1PPCAC_17378 [Pristionchus fissidentatus]